jgi:RimJ/RimL family protein N-acetyltransferase
VNEGLFSAVTVRRLEAADRPVILTWLKDPVVRAAVQDEDVRTDRPSDTLALFEECDPFRKGDLCLLAEKEGQPFALIRFSWINWVNRNAEVMIFIGPRDRRRSLAAIQAVEKIGDVAFNSLNLHKVYAFIYGSNGDSLGVFGRIMKTEARLKGYLKTETGYEDFLVLGLLADDYRRLMDRARRRPASTVEASR